MARKIVNSNKLELFETIGDSVFCYRFMKETTVTVYSVLLCPAVHSWFKVTPSSLQ